MRIVVDFKEPEPTGCWIGAEHEEVEVACLQYLKSITAHGRFGDYYIHKFQTLNGNIVCINSNDVIPAGKEWWTFHGWIRSQSIWDGQRETFVGHPRGIEKFTRHARAKLQALPTCPTCGLPTKNALPPFCCTCIDVEILSQTDWWDTDPFAIMLDPEDKTNPQIEVLESD